MPARGISIRRVEANTGVAILIGENGQWVGAEGRNAPLPKGRNTAVRVYVDVDEAVWVERDIEARLHIHLPDGTVETLVETETIATDSSPTSLQSNFLFGVIAEWMVPNVRYQVELFEGSDAGWQGLPEASEPPRTPPEPEIIGVESTPLEMKIQLIPVDYQGPGCSRTIEQSDELFNRYADEIYQLNPVETLSMEWHEPYVVDDLDLRNTQDFYTLLSRASQLRAEESPAPNVYYYMLFDNCGACIPQGQGPQMGCVLGVAPGTPNDSIGAAGMRVAIGAQFLGTNEVGMGTFVHEVGHSQGRAHVACPGADALGPDISYPYEGGKIGVWGFGVRDFNIRNPSSHTDYMSYCNPVWVSDWQWKATYDRISTLTSWDTTDAAMPPGASVLVGAVNPTTGESNWWTDQGFVDQTVTRPAGHELRFMAGDEELDHTTVQVEPWSEGPWVTVRAPLPAGFTERATAIEYRSPQRTLQVSRAAIRLYHDGGGLKAP